MTQDIELKELARALNGDVYEPFEATATVGNGVNKLKVRVRKKRPAIVLPEWFEKPVTDDNGRVLAILANLMIALRSAPELRDCFAYDEMARSTLFVNQLPLVDGATAPAPPPRLLRDTDVTQLQEYLQHVGLQRIGADTTHQAIALRAQDRSFHPVREYLDGLEWDTMPRLDTFLSYYFGAPLSAYTMAIGRMFLISMVARIFKPGCQCDYMMVLEGLQGARKSSACRTLAGDWFSDSLPDIRAEREVSQHLRGKWLIEISELSSINRAETERLKLFLTRREEEYLARYGRNEVKEPRQCVFIGSTNKDQYLKDETGGRRFWPVPTGEIDVDALAHDRDQLFAEAVHCFKLKEQWWPERDFEQLHIKPEQDGRFEADAWADSIAIYAETHPEGVRLKEIALDVLNMDIGKVGTAEQRRIVGVLTNLGFKGKKDMHGMKYSRRTDQ